MSCSRHTRAFLALTLALEIAGPWSNLAELGEIGSEPPESGKLCTCLRWPWCSWRACHKVGTSWGSALFGVSSVSPVLVIDTIQLLSNQVELPSN